MTEIQMGERASESQFEAAWSAIGSRRRIALGQVPPWVVLVFAGLTGAAVIAVGILFANAGHFEYSLDDAYIHLRLSQTIAGGTYGINAGQPASPSSSIIWPFLLVPFVGTSLHPYVPLAISVLSLAGTLLAGYRGLSVTWETFDPTGRRRTAAIVFAGIFLNWFGLPFTGLEHSLHVLTAVGCAAGLLVVSYRGRAPWWFWLSILVGPVVRYEGLAVSAVTLVAIAFLGRWRQSLAAGAALMVPVGLFSVFLRSQGLPALPDSVVAKWDPAQGGTVFALIRHVVLYATANLAWHTAVILLLAVCLASTVALAARAGRRGAREPGIGPLLSGAGVLLLHAAFGNLGGYSRYDIYALSYACTVLLAALGPFFRFSFRAVGALATLLIPATFGVFAAPVYVIDTLTTPMATQGIRDEQHEMHVFAVDFLKAPVAVNDLGEVSYNNPNEVVDLWGLGSDAALHARLSGKPQWMSSLVDPRSVPAAMIYTDWFGDAIPTTWVKVGTISVQHQGTAAEPEVDVYATSRDSEPQVVRALALFQKRTGGRTYVTVTPGS